MIDTVALSEELVRLFAEYRAEIVKTERKRILTAFALWQADKILTPAIAEKIVKAEI